MNKLVTVFNILSAIPAALVVPLVPFTFFLVEGEGRVPGDFHEYLLHFLMVCYPVVWVLSLWGSRRLLRTGKSKPALGLSLTPFGVFLLLLWTYLAGGVVLR